MTTRLVRFKEPVEEPDHPPHQPPSHQPPIKPARVRMLGGRNINDFLITLCACMGVSKITPQVRKLNRMYGGFEQMETESGNVYKCRNRRTNEVVRLKIIPISKEEKENGVPYRIIREVSILKELNHENVVRFVDVVPTEDAVFLAFENLDTDLYSYLKDGQMFLPLELSREYARQMLNAVAYIHSWKILHRHLNTHNILVNVQTHVLKIADFGGARTFEVPPDSYSQNVGTLSYRAPELLLGSTNYSTPNDVWSVGCIFGEMFLRKPLFAAASSWEVLDQIFDLLGTPTEETWPGVTSLCDGNINILGTPKEPKDLGSVFRGLGEYGIDVLSKMLCLCPNERISAEDALDHRFFKGIAREEFIRELELLV